MNKAEILEAIDSGEYYKEYILPPRNMGNHSLSCGNMKPVETNPDGSYVRDKDGRIPREWTYSHRGYELTGWRTSDVKGKALLCYKCGESVPLNVTRAGFLKAVSECTMPNGALLEFELAIPSGVMFVGNDFRDLGDWAEDAGGACGDWDDADPRWREYDMDIGPGLNNISKWYAGRKLAHAFTGNTCPSVYKVGKDHLQIATGGWDADGNDVELEGERVANICTDLWWFSIADKDEYLSRDPNPNMQYIDEVVVKPGVYKFTHHYNMNYFDRDAEVAVFTDIQRIPRRRV